jgi:hypothetical protein
MIVAFFFFFFFFQKAGLGFALADGWIGLGSSCGGYTKAAGGRLVASMQKLLFPSFPWCFQVTINKCRGL